MRSLDFAPLCRGAASFDRIVNMERPDEGGYSPYNIKKAGDRAYLHRGIASRGVLRVWCLAYHVEVVGAKLEHGLLHIDHECRVPEAKEACRIEIAGGNAEAPAIEGETVN